MSTRKDRASEEKRAALEDFLAHGPAMLHLDARLPGVRVPPWLQDDLQLRLRVSPRFDPPDLFIDEWGVRQTLSFQGRRFPVAIPWQAIFGLSDASDELRLFPRSMPYELIEAVASSQGLTGEEFEKLRELEEHGEAAPAVITFSPPDDVLSPPPRQRPRLVSIDLADRGVTDGEAGDAPTTRPAMDREVPESSEEDKARRRAHLRVVK